MTKYSEELSEVYIRNREIAHIYKKKIGSCAPGEMEIVDK